MLGGWAFWIAQGFLQCRETSAGCSHVSTSAVVRLHRRAAETKVSLMQKHSLICLQPMFECNLPKQPCEKASMSLLA
eukprot:6373536-Amphidinium_carterae.1